MGRRRPPRRPLTRVGGPVQTAGEPGAARALAQALRVDPDGRGGPSATHGFHPYPARLHPETARRLIAAFAPEGGPVADPMCGSGTVCVAALCAGHAAVGCDLSPVAIDIARVATWVTTATERRSWLARSRVVAGIARDAAASAVDAAMFDDVTEAPAGFDPGIASDLAALHAAIGRERNPRQRLALAVAASALLTRVSDREAETSDREVERSRGEAQVWWRFARKCRELEERWHDLARRVARPAPDCALHVADARDCAPIPDASVDLVVTSPPYPATYDYADIHADRFAWLGHDPAAFRRGEIGARRDLARGSQALQRWDADGAAMLRACARILRPGGRAVWVVGDGGVRGRPLRHDEALRRWAAAAGLAVVAQATQERPPVGRAMRVAFGGAVKREHAVLLQRGAR